MTKWCTEAEFLEELSDENIFRNGDIENFLLGERVFWVVSSKGMGKTLLLRYKRKLIEDNQKFAGITIIPRNKMLDYVKLPAFLPQEHLSLMEDKFFWNDLWELSIGLSIFLNISWESFNKAEQDNIIETVKSFEINELIEEFNKKLRYADIYLTRNPSDILVILLSSGIKRLQKIRTKQIQTIYKLYTDYLRSGVYLFIDSFDQALKEKYHDNLEIWIAGQLGLLSAAWNISRHNPHIKIYTSIRQEAWSSFTSDNKMAMLSSILLISYNNNELAEIMNKAVRTYEDKENLKEFLGVEEINNKYIGTKEDSFQYIYRHTIGTPRSLMVIGNALSNKINNSNTKKENISIIRNIVNSSMAEEIATNYLLNEMNIFLDALKTKDQIHDFFKNIPRNVLTYQELRRICSRFNGKKCRNNCIQCNATHPLCELYNIGLLGLVNKKLEDDMFVQSFKKPFEFDWNMRGILPKREHYLIHPALQYQIIKHNPNYKLYKQILIGDALPWKHEYNDLLNKERVRIFVSYSTKDTAIVSRFIDELYKFFDQEGISCDLWIDKWKLRSGRWIPVEIEEGIRQSDLLLLCVSKASLQSKWVEREWRCKFEEELKSGDVKVIPILIGVDHSLLPEILKGKFTRQLPIRYGIQFSKAVQDIATDLSLIYWELNQR